MIILTGIVTSLMLTFYATPFAGAWVYAIWVLLINTYQIKNYTNYCKILVVSPTDRLLLLMGSPREITFFYKKLLDATLGHAIYHLTTVFYSQIM